MGNGFTDRFRIRKSRRFIKKHRNRLHVVGLGAHYDDIAVIGNIHDNPELLEGEHGKEAAKCDCGERCEQCDPALRHND